MNEKTEDFFIGQKVLISKNGGWKGNFTGKIALPPKIDFFKDHNNNHFRKIKIGKREIIFVWVVFDNPQYDADGDGHYSEAEINTDYLEIIED
jgi:hypothetical protein